MIKFMLENSGFNAVQFFFHPVEIHIKVPDSNFFRAQNIFENTGDTQTSFLVITFVSVLKLKTPFT